VEIKNMNSFRAVERALEYEAQRQWHEWQQTHQKLGDVPKQTRGWDDAAGVTRAQRSKEESSDYRYFPDPDLVPVIVTPADIDEVRASLGELPAALRTRLQTDFGLSHYDADVLVNRGRDFVKFFIETSGDGRHPKKAANIVTQFVAGTLNENPGLQINNFPITSGTLCSTIDLMDEGVIPSARFPDVYDHLLATGSNDPLSTIQMLGIQEVDESELMTLCRQLLAANPKIIADVQRGNTKAVGALIGQAKKMNPNVDPGRVRELCLRLIQTAEPPE
jgi:aspartyl-tRNA(Asn)/glutamyl-tRNA(Gln) amidotransferase subunit B